MNNACIVICPIFFIRILCLCAVVTLGVADGQLCRPRRRQNGGQRAAVVRILSLKSSPSHVSSHITQSVLLNVYSLFRIHWLALAFCRLMTINFVIPSIRIMFFPAPHNPLCCPPPESLAGTLPPSSSKRAFATACANRTRSPLNWRKRWANSARSSRSCACCAIRVFGRATGTRYGTVPEMEVNHQDTSAHKSFVVS